MQPKIDYKKILHALKYTKKKTKTKKHMEAHGKKHKNAYFIKP